MLFVDIERHEVLYFFSGNCGERFIAYGTAGEGLRKHASWKSGKDLPHLRAAIVVGNQEVVGCQGTFGKGGIPRQDYPVLLERKADNFVVIVRPVIEDVESEQSHPLREPAQHDIGDEFHKSE